MIERRPHKPDSPHQDDSMLQLTVLLEVDGAVISLLSWDLCSFLGACWEPLSWASVASEGSIPLACESEPRVLAA